MPVTDKITEINDVLKDIFNFIQNNEEVRADFEEYLATIGSKNISLNKIEKIFLPYIFERKLNDKFILELYGAECKNKEIVDSLLDAQASVFEIKKILKTGFELYNLVNEKTYTVSSLTKMTNFRGVYSGQYIAGRIFSFHDENYIVEISSVLSHSQKTEAYRFAVMKLIQNPKALYYDNPEKEQVIIKTIGEMHEKFNKAFETDIILTTNKHADDIIGAFNEGEDVDLSDKGSNIENYKFFHVKELENNYSNFLESSMGGFASHNETYDVAVIFDKEKGLYAVPFFETFCHIFENKDSVENAKQCIEYFLANESIPNTIIERVYKKYPNFMETVNGFLETNYSFDELMQKYKSEYLSNKIYSSATVLFCSNAFSEVFDIISEPKPETPVTAQKVGRNELCPCGSGKKYKNCCGRE